MESSRIILVRIRALALIHWARVTFSTVGICSAAGTTSRVAPSVFSCEDLVVFSSLMFSGRDTKSRMKRGKFFGCSVLTCLSSSMSSSRDLRDDVSSNVQDGSSCDSPCGVSCDVMDDVSSNVQDDSPCDVLRGLQNDVSFDVEDGSFCDAYCDVLCGVPGATTGSSEAQDDSVGDMPRDVPCVVHGDVKSGA